MAPTTCSCTCAYSRATSKPRGPRTCKPDCRRLSGRLFARSRLGLRLGAVAGIDFGTTHSTISVVLDGQVQPVPVDEGGSVLLPSTVSYSSEAGSLVGHRRESAAAPNVTFVDNVKRLMGRTYDECTTHQLGYATAKLADGKIGIKCQHDNGGTLTVPEVSSEILKVLKRKAEEFLGASVDAAVMTVPSEYTNDQRLATMDAAALCGIARVSLLQEPVAAAMSHGLGKPEQEESAILVVDIGGGTCDVSLLQSFEGLLEVIGYDGDSRLGGVDLDEAILGHWLTNKLPEAISVDQVQEQDPQKWVTWRAEAERCKIALSTQPSCDVKLEVSGSSHAFCMTREDLRDAAQPFLERLAMPLQRIAETHSLAYGTVSESAEKMNEFVDKYAPPPRRVTQLILVGGVTESPVVREYIEGFVDCSCCQLEGDSRSCVSRGAAMHAAIMTGELTGGLELGDGLFVQELQSRTSGFQL